MNKHNPVINNLIVNLEDNTTINDFSISKNKTLQKTKSSEDNYTRNAIEKVSFAHASLELPVT